MLALQDDDATQGDPFDKICDYFASSCEEDLNKDKPADESGQLCKTTSCTGGTTETCSSPSETSACGGTTYTMSESTLAYTTTCSKVADRKFNLAIAASFHRDGRRRRRRVELRGRAVLLHARRRGALLRRPQGRDQRQPV